MNTAEIISRVTLTLSLINSKNDLDFVGWVIKTLCLFYFIFYFYGVKFHCVKEIYMMLVAFWRWWKLLQHLSAKDNERNLCQDLLTIENTDSELKVHALHYANELLIYASDFPLKNFCKLAKETEAIRDYQKQGLVMIKHCFGETLKLTRYQSKEFSFITFLYRTNAKAYAFNQREHILFIHSAKLKSCFRPWNTHVFHQLRA